jgi:hypothetical protein
MPTRLVNSKEEQVEVCKIRIVKIRVVVRDLTCDSSLSLRQPCLDNIGPILLDGEGILHCVQMKVHSTKIAYCVGIQGSGLISLLKKAANVLPVIGTRGFQRRVH